MNKFFSLLGGDYGIIQTVWKMKSVVYNSMRHPAQTLRRRAETLLADSLERDEISELQNIFYFVQEKFHYVNDPYDIELLKTPDKIESEIVEKGSFMGDCDDASAYLAALLKLIGYQPFFTIAVPEDGDGFDFSHVYVTVYLPTKNLYVALDPTAKGKPFGWRVPAKKEKHYAV